MTDSLAQFWWHLHSMWTPYYLPLMILAILLAFGLRKSTHGMLVFSVQMLVLFVLLMIGSAVAAGVSTGSSAGPLHELAVLILGMLLIRLLAFSLFRQVVPRLGFQPPRILEELLVLLAYCAWILVRLSASGLDLGSLVASTAVITAVLAFAMQDTLGNILSGLALQLDRSVHIGDWIELDDVTGEVLQVQWRHTAVQTLFGEMVLIPNSQLMKSRVKLVGGPSVPQRLRLIRFYGGFDVRPGDVVSAVDQGLSSTTFKAVATDPPPSCIISDFQEGLIVYSVRYWLTDPSSPGQTDSLVRHHIQAIVEREGWNMGVPARDIVISSHNAKARSKDARDRQQVGQRFKALRKVSLFEPLTDDELDRLTRAMKTVFYLPDSMLARQGQTGDYLFIVVRGEVDVWLEAQGRRHPLAVLGAGEVIGEMSLLTGDPRRATLTARTDVECYVLGKEAFETILRDRPELADAFALLLAQRKRELNELRDNVDVVPVSEERAVILARIRRLFGL